MRAVRVLAPGGPEVLRIDRVPDPSPGAGELLLRVLTAGVNRADVLQRQGRYPPPPGEPNILGLEVAGEVVALGEEVTGWAVGDRACGLLGGGGYAELAVLPAEVAMPWPDGLDDVGAGAVPEVFATAHDNVFTRGRLRRGEATLVHGGLSGVGTASLQLARRAGARAFATAGGAQRAARCIEFGAEAGIDHHAEDFVERARELTGGRGVDVILDIIGARYLERNLEALALDGRLVVIGLMGGATTPLDLGVLMRRRASVLASTMRARSTAEKAAVASALVRDVWPGFADGSLRPVIDRVVPLENVAEAHRVMERGEHVGKIVLRVAG